MARINAPKSVVKYNYSKKSKSGEVKLKFVSNVDRVNYTLKELIHAANRDVGVFLAKQANANASRTFRGFQLSKSKRLGQNLQKNKLLSPAFQYWARQQETDLQVGVGKNDSTGDTWYGVQQELGSATMPKYGILRNTVNANIGKIRDIQAKYLSGIEDEIKAEQLVLEADKTENEA